MQKIKDLHQFLVNLNLVAAEQIDSVADDVTITPAGYLGPLPGELIVAEKDYIATFNIERYPHGQVSEDVLLAQISTWLLENDIDRLDTVKIELIVDALDAQTVNLEFGIPFNEWIIATEDINGAIEYNGTRYTLP